MTKGNVFVERRSGKTKEKDIGLPGAVSCGNVNPRYVGETNVSNRTQVIF